MKNTPAHRQEWILEELKREPLLSYGDCWSKYKVTWSKSESTFATDWKKAKAEIETYQIKGGRISNGTTSRRSEYNIARRSRE